MYPHERSLVKRLQDRPFALLGVNTDDSREELQQAIKEQEITWRSWWDGPVGGPITQLYHISAFPTLMLIDHKGMVRYEWKGAPSQATLDRALDKLLAEAEKDAAR